MRRADGAYRWFLFRVEPVRDEAGQVVEWYGTGTDIHDRKQAELLRVAEKRTLEMIANGASLADTLNDLCRAIDAHSASSVYSTILLMDPEGKQLWHAAGPRVPSGWLPAISPRPIGPSEGCCGAAAYLKERVIVADVSTDPVWSDKNRDLALRNGIRAAWSEPILTKDGEVLGTFALYSSEPRMPTHAEIELIDSAGKTAEIAIGRQRALGARAIDQSIAVIGLDGQMLYANRVLVDYTGLRLEDLSSLGFRQRVVHPDDVERLHGKRQQALSAGVPFELEVRLRRHDGAYRWFLVRYNPFRDERGSVTDDEIGRRSD